VGEGHGFIAGGALIRREISDDIRHAHHYVTQKCGLRAADAGPRRLLPTALLQVDVGSLGATPTNER